MFVEFEEVVSESIATIGAAGNDEIAKQYCRQWLYRGLMQLGTTDDTIEVCKVDAKNLLIKKPKNLKKLLEIALYDANDCFLPHTYRSGNKRIYPETGGYTYTVNEGTDEEVTYTLPVDLSENRTSYVIGTNGTMVSYGMLRYYPYPLDQNGIPLIREDEVEALTLYCRLKWSMRRNENQSEIGQNRLAWQQAADICRAAKKSADMSNETRKAMASDFNRMLPNFNRSRF
jgi:hypothetical protein